MKEVSKAAFNFKSYKISQFALNEPANGKNELSIKFNPSGNFLSTSEEFHLELKFSASLNDNSESFLTATLEAIFAFENVKSIDEIPDFFYVNSIAIVFPYLRAFITTLTSVAGTKPLILPTYNLTHLGSLLKNSTSNT